MKIDKIVILGGGSAGWMTAATMIRTFPEKEIVVVESPNVQTVGVGESTLGQIKRWTRYIGLDEDDFMAFTDATYKLTIQFRDFYKQDSGAFHYPFGTPYSDDLSDNPINDWHVMREYYPDVKNTDMVDMLFPGAALWNTNKYNENLDGSLGNFDSDDFVAYHFDALRFGLWLKERYCLPRGVKYISKHMDHVETSENGVDCLVMDDGKKVVADLYIDCTGFKSLIMDKAMNEPFISYEDILPNNSAWATQIPYVDKYKELELFTNGTAIQNGWVWNIPLWSRIGTGYVYSDKYVSDEDALEEFKQYLCSEKMLCPRTREEVDGYSFKNIKMRVGIHERVFVKNVAAIGLAAGFIEPLESNGLFSVHEFLFKLIEIMQRGEISQFDRMWYNAEVRDMFDGFAKFVAMHYSMSHRNDTPYWKAIMEREYTELRWDNKEYYPEMLRTETFRHAQNRFFDIINQRGINDIDGVSYIATGMNYRPIGGSRLDVFEFRRGAEQVRERAQQLYSSWNERMVDWQNVAKQSVHIVDYLKNKFYSQ